MDIGHLNDKEKEREIIKKLSKNSVYIYIYGLDLVGGERANNTTGCDCFFIYI
jgi:hypothetical protein